MAGKLFLLLPEFRGIVAQTIAGIWGIASQDQKEISTLDDMAKEIGRHKALDDLVIFVHGTGGGMMLDDANYGLTDAALAKALTKQKTVIQNIRFEGCWMGENPADMVVFGQLFGAKTISGFTWACWTSEVNVTIPKGISAKDLAKFLKDQNMEKWLMPGTPTIPVLASMAKGGDVKKTLPMMWYQYSLDMKPPYVDNNFAKLGRHTYGARGDVAKVAVAAKSAKNSTAPSPPFEYVTVTL
jgi:hypothetical protein